MISKLIKKIKQSKKDFEEYFNNLGITAKIIHTIVIISILEIIVRTLIQPMITYVTADNKIKKQDDKTLLSIINSSKTFKGNDYLKIYVNYKNNTMSFYKQSKEKKELLKVFPVTYNSFIMNYEKILIKNRVNYSVVQEPSALKNYPIISFIKENIHTLIILIIFLYMFEAQGLLGDNKKYKKINPKTIKGEMEDLIGIEEIKKDILQLADILKNKDKYKEFAIENGFNILMSGPPGTGKTKMASYLAKELDIPFLIGTGNVETGFVAGGSTTLKRLFESARVEARMHPSRSCMIFLDEAQVLMGERGKHSKHEDDASNELLSQLDGINTTNDVNIILIAASNFDSSNMALDEAMLRRFHKKLYFRLPNRNERREILKYYISKINPIHISDDINIEHLAEITSQCSPAIIESIIKEAGLISINETKKITTSIIDRAYEVILIGKTTYNKDNDAIIDIVSHHEIGHFIQEYEILKGKYSQDNKTEIENLSEIQKHIQTLKISVEGIEQYKTLGYVLNKEDNMNLKTKKDLENDIVKLYGGIAAEKVFFGETDDNITIGSANDIEKVSKIFNTMINKLGMYNKNQKINLSLIDNIDKNKENTKILEKESERIYSQAVLNIKNNKELIEYLAHELIEYKVLNVIEVFKKIELFVKEK